MCLQSVYKVDDYFWSVGHLFTLECLMLKAKYTKGILLWLFKKSDFLKTWRKQTTRAAHHFACLFCWWSVWGSRSNFLQSSKRTKKVAVLFWVCSVGSIACGFVCIPKRGFFFTSVFPFSWVSFHVTFPQIFLAAVSAGGIMCCGSPLQQPC